MELDTLRAQAWVTAPGTLLPAEMAPRHSPA
jgi:hypothetical protein